MIEVAIRTFSTIIGLQVFGKQSFNKLVVRQYEAFVNFAISLYLLECKKVKEFWSAFDKSLISEISKFDETSIFVFNNFDILSIDIGP